MAVSPELHALVDQLSDRGLRVGQIFCNVFCDITVDGHDPFYTDDDIMNKRLSRYLKSYIIKERNNATKSTT